MQTEGFILHLLHFHYRTIVEETEFVLKTKVS